ncbi:hypothetical protein T484DRAFT_1797843, partial [Baffinella frigidus]
DEHAGYARVLTVHRPDAPCDAPGYWPPGAHSVFVVGASLKGGSEGHHASGTTMHVITLTSLLAVSVFRIDAARLSVALAHRVHLAMSPSALALHPSGHYLLLSAANGQVDVLHLQAGRLKGSFQGTPNPKALALDAVTIWCGRSGRKLASLAGLPSRLVSVAWRAGGAGLSGEAGCGTLVVLGASGAVVLVRVGRGLWSRAADVLYGRRRGAGGLTLQVKRRGGADTPGP